MRLWVLVNTLLGFLLAVILYDAKPNTYLSKENNKNFSQNSPKRIIVLSPALLEIVFDAGFGKRVIAIPDFAIWPKKALNLPRIGGRFNPNKEAILALKPDLLIFQGNDIKIKEFAKINGIKVNDPGIKLDNLNDIFNAYTTIGILLKNPVKAEKRAFRLRIAFAELMEKSFKRKTRKRVLLLLGKRKGSFKGIYTATNKTFIGEILKKIGAINVFGKAMGLWPKISNEAITAKNPECVLILSPGIQLNQNEEQKEWEKFFPSIEAVKKKKIFVIKKDFILIPGPRIIETARIFEELVYGSN